MPDDRGWGELDEYGLGMREVPAREYARIYQRRPASLARRLRRDGALAWLRLTEVLLSEGAWVLLVIGSLTLSLTVGLALARALAGGLLPADVVSLVGVAGAFLVWSLALAGWCTRQMAAEPARVTDAAACRRPSPAPPVRPGIVQSLLDGSQRPTPYPRRGT